MLLKMVSNVNYFIYKEVGTKSIQEGCFPQNARVINEENFSITQYENYIRIDIYLGDSLSKGFQVVPCLSINSSSSYGYQATIKYNVNNKNHDVSISPIGEYIENYKRESSSSHVSSEIDLFITKKPIENVTLSFKVTGISISELEKNYSLVSISIFDNFQKESSQSLDNEIELDVPRKSQMLFEPEIRRRICSPTSISMVQEYYGRKSDVIAIANRAYNKIHDMYGIWPQNIWAMLGNGLSGYVSKLSNFEDVVYFLNNNIPLIASINYGEGELTNAAIEKTPGHLVVIIGMTKEHVIVNDPAANSLSSVRRLYDIHEFKKAWLDKKGIVYIIYPYGKEK